MWGEKSQYVCDGYIASNIDTYAHSETYRYTNTDPKTNYDTNTNRDTPDVSGHRNCVQCFISVLHWAELQEGTWEKYMRIRQMSAAELAPTPASASVTGGYDLIRTPL